MRTHPRHVETDRDGNFALARMPPHATRINVNADGYIATSIRLPPNADVLDVEMVSGGTIAGSLALPDGSPARGRVRVKPVAEDSSVSVMVFTGGRFRSEPVPDGEYRVGADAEAGPVESRSVVIQGGRSVENVHLVVQPRTGRVVGRISGAPPTQKVLLTVRDRKGRELYNQVFPNGAYVLENVPEVAIVIAAIRTAGEGVCRLARKVRLDDQGEARMDFDFSARSKLEGVVRAGGRPIGSVRLNVMPQNKSQPMASTTTDELGQYAVSGLADGLHVVRTRGQLFEVEVAGRTEFDFALPDATVYGTAQLAETGTAAVGAIVRLTRIDGDRRVGAGIMEKVESDGGFRFRGLAEGEYMVEALWSYRMVPQRVRLAAGEALELSLELEGTKSDEAAK